MGGQPHLVNQRTPAGALMPVDADQFPDLGTTFLAEIPVSDLPHVVEHVHQHLKEHDPESVGTFVFGLDLILDGLERALRKA